MAKGVWLMRLCSGCGWWWSGRFWSDLGAMVVWVIFEGARLEVVACTGVIGLDFPWDGDVAL